MIEVGAGGVRIAILIFQLHTLSGIVWISIGKTGVFLSRTCCHVSGNVRFGNVGAAPACDGAGNEWECHEPNPWIVTSIATMLWPVGKKMCLIVTRSVSEGLRSEEGPRILPRSRFGLRVSRRCCRLSHFRRCDFIKKGELMKSNPTRASPSSFGNLHSNLERGYEPGPGGNNR